MGWGAALKAGLKVARPAAKLAYETYKAVTYVHRKTVDAAVATKNAAVWTYDTTKDAAITGAIATKDAAVWAYDTSKDTAIAGANAAKNAVVAGKNAAINAADELWDGVRAAAISDREQQIRNAYGTAHEKLGHGVAGCPSQECPFKKAECTRLADAKEKAILADHVYMNQGSEDDLDKKVKYEAYLASRGIVPLDVEKDKAELVELLGDENIKGLLEPDGQSFRARIYRKPPGPDGKVEYVVSFRGTQTKEDWFTNFRQGLGLETRHYEKAKKLARKLKHVDGSKTKVSFAGHSLGGGLASAAAYVSGYPASTYNSAGLNMNTVDGYNPSKAGPVNAFFNAADPLSAAQDNREPILNGLTKGVGFIPKVGKLLQIPMALWIGKNDHDGTPILPQAYGVRKPIPLPTLSSPPGVIEGHGVPMLIDGIEMQQRQLGCQ